MKPSPYMVCVTLPDQPDKLYRVGPAMTLEKCKKAIARDLADMRDTLGGLLEQQSVKGRKYYVFKAEWTEVTNELMDADGSIKL